MAEIYRKSAWRTHNEANDPRFADSEPEEEAYAQEAYAPAAADPNNGYSVVDLGGGPQYVRNDQVAQLASMGALANRALHQYQQQAPQYQPQPRPIVDEARIRHTVKNIQYGSKEEASKALAGLVYDVASRQRDVDQAAEQAVARNRAREWQQAQFANEAAQIQHEYGDLFQDQVRRQAAAAQGDQILRRNISLGHVQSDLDIYREAGNNVRRAFGVVQEQRPRRARATSSTRGQSDEGINHDYIARMRIDRGFGRS